MSNDVCYLVKKIETVNNVGDVLYTDELREVFCEIASVGRSEFYQGMAKGLKPDMLIILEDYQAYEGEKELIHNNVRYKVLKTYKKQDHRLELTCYSEVWSNERA